MIIVLWHPLEKRWVFCKAFVLVFGLAGAVLHFNRVPTFFSAICRHWFALPTQHFFDDFRLLDPRIAGESGFETFKEAADLFGFIFDPGKDNPLAPKLPLLGNIEDYSRTSIEDRVYIEARPDRIKAVTRQLVQIASERRLTSAVAASVRGKLLNLSQAREGRTGRATLAGLNRAASTTGFSGWNEQIEWDIEFAIES